MEVGVESPWLLLLHDPERKLVSATAVVSFGLPDGVSDGTLRRASLTDSSKPLCSGGIETSQARVDARAPGAPLPVTIDESRALSLRFEQGSDQAGLPAEHSVLDLLVEAAGTRTCLRVPFTRRGGEGDWKAALDWFVGVGVRGHYFVPAPRTDTGADLSTVRLAVGRWTSKTTRVFVEPGYSGGGAQRTQFSLGVHHEKVFLRRGKFAAGVSAGYVAMALPGRFATTEPWFLHGPEFALRLKETLPESIGGGFPGLLQDAAAELILPVNVWFGHGAQTRALGFTVGWGIAFD